MKLLYSFFILFLTMLFSCLCSANELQKARRQVALSYLENSNFFTAAELMYPYGDGTRWTSRDYLEFFKLYNSPNQAEAVDNFKTLLKNAKTDAAKAWAYYGLFQLGEIKLSEIPALSCYYLNLFFLKEDVLDLSNFVRAVKSPSPYYAEVDLDKFKLPTDEKSYALWVLKNTGMFAQGAVASDGHYPRELWATRILTKSKNAEENLKLIRELCAQARNVAGRLYCVKMLLLLGNDQEAKAIYNSIDKSAKLYTQSGCICSTVKAGDITFEAIAKANKSFPKRFSGYIPSLPQDEYGKSIPYNKSENLQKHNFDDSKLGYMPMRFLLKGGAFIGGDGLYNLMKFFNYDTKENVLSLLKYRDANAPEFLCLSFNEPLVIKKNKRGEWTIIEESNLFNEYANLLPCFNGYFANNEIGNLAKKILFMRLLESQKKYGVKNHNLSECGFFEMREASNFAFAIHNKYKNHKGFFEYIGENGVPLLLERFEKNLRTFDCEPIAYLPAVIWTDNMRSTWVVPVFKETPQIVIDALKKRYAERLAQLDPKSRDFVAKFLERKIAELNADCKK